jgi:D-alanyl-D-alanine carboxypeptidase
MAPDQMARIFAQGFMNRSDGHGFGLHSCVVAAREMGGVLTGHSDGPGTGSTFTLELPVAGTDGALADSRPALMEPGSKGRTTVPMAEPPASPQPA